MDEWQKISVELKQDREALLLILAKNGYTVRQTRTKSSKGTSYNYFVEYRKEGGSA